MANTDSARAAKTANATGTREEHRRAALAAVVLAGGRSTRMGRDKATLPLPNGMCVLERLLHLEAGFARHLAVSVRRDERPDLRFLAGWRPRRPVQIKILPDDGPEAGPMGGIATGLARAEKDGYRDVLILSCDVPLMNAGLLARLLAAHDARPKECVATCLSTPDGKVHPLVSVWSVEARPILEKALAEGNLSLLQAVPKTLVHIVPCNALESVFATNVNTPEDWKKASTLFVRLARLDELVRRKLAERKQHRATARTPA